jgi:small conductance mechanosensitive channel
VQRFGAIEVAPVRFEGKPLFKVVSPTVRDRGDKSSQPVELRVEQVETNLKLIIGENEEDLLYQDQITKRGYVTNFDPKSLKVYVVDSADKASKIIYAKDDHRTEPLQLVTVTRLDAEYYGLSRAELAIRWQSILQTRLSDALNERSLEVVAKRPARAISYGLVALGASLLLWLLSKALHRYDRWLKSHQIATKTATITGSSVTGSPTAQAIALGANHSVSMSTTSPDPVAPPTANSASTTHEAIPSYEETPDPLPRLTGLPGLLSRWFGVSRQRNAIALVRWCLSWMQIFMWTLCLVSILYLFPATRALSSKVLGVPLYCLGIWLAVGVANWLGDLVIDRLADVWENGRLSALQLFSVDDVQRRSLRISTAVRALKGLKTFVVYAIGAALVLQQLGVPIGSVLTGSAIVVFAISLGFQSVVKDLVNGCLILWEDQYGIGDVVSINNSLGFVENMNLRITQVRNPEGRLITIPNSSITAVENLTRTWSRVDFAVEVAYEANLKKVIEVINQVCQELYAEPDWQRRMPDPPAVLGVDNISHSGMTIRVWLKTLPHEQWPVGREFRRRIRLAFEANKIPIGTPHQSYQLSSSIPDGFGQPFFPPTPTPASSGNAPTA